MNMRLHALTLPALAVLATVAIAVSCAHEPPAPLDLADAPRLGAQDADAGLDAGDGGLLPPGAPCTSHGDCESGSCRGRCCAQTCNWQCPVANNPWCNDYGACLSMGPNHYYWCSECGFGTYPVLGPCDPVDGPLPCPIAPDGTSCHLGLYETGWCQSGYCVQIPPPPLGSPCPDPGYSWVQDGQCCVGGIWCNFCCDSPCGACSVAKGAAVDGQCVLFDGAACDDSNACTEGDACNQGLCQGSTVSCPPPDECHDAACDPKAGCGTTPKADGTPCTAGACLAGVCTPAGTGGSSTGGTGGTTGTGGTAGAATGGAATGGSGGATGGGATSSASSGAASVPAQGQVRAGASCAFAPAASSASPWAAVLALLSLSAASSRPRGARRRPSRRRPPRGS
jgi:hypothetical protein